MTRHSGGDWVDAGMYWNPKSMNVVGLRTEGVLPGGEELCYRRLPFFVLFLLMTALGGAYILFLPVLIICATVYMLGVRVFGSLLLQIRRSLSFGWRPQEAYLSGKGKARAKKSGENGKREK
jgi:hypothetical protein